MNITRICTLYFSATGNTAHVVNLLAETMAKQMNIPLANFPFTGASDREKDYSFTENDVAIIGAPTYAGKLPNKILPDFRDKLHGKRRFWNCGCDLWQPGLRSFTGRAVLRYGGKWLSHCGGRGLCRTAHLYR